jgi:hypothetical protein
LGGYVDHSRTLRGAICGAAAAGVWALQQPFDKQLFASRYDDVEVLGKALTRGEGWYPAGLVLHLQNGALFGAAYANLAPLMPVTPVLRGPLAALGELVITWPLAALSDRFHPARDELTALFRNRRGFAQAAWRHLVFGVVLGELERQVNAAIERGAAEPEADYSSNGHGSLEHAVSAS